MIMTAGSHWRDFAYALGLQAGPRPSPIPPFDLFSTFTGTSGDDGFAGTRHADTFNMAQGGHDTVKASKGNDIINFGGTFERRDAVDGGKGADALNLNGDYSGAHAVLFRNATLKNVETVNLGGGHSYEFTFAAGNIAAGAHMDIDGSALGAADHMTIDAASIAGALSIVAGAGSDALTGGASDDTFDLSHGGNDTVNAGDGNDTVVLGAALTAADAIDGGDGTLDRVELNGDYSGADAVVFAGATMTNVETLALSGGSFTLTTHDASVAFERTLTVDAVALSSTDMLIFDGSAETDGVFDITSHAGASFLTGGTGDDNFRFAGNFTPGDRVNGGGGVTNTLFLDGDYSAGLMFESATVRNIKEIVLGADNAYSLTTDNGNLSVNQSMRIDGSAASQLVFDGSDESAQGFTVTGSGGDDTLIAGDGQDFFTPGAGIDNVAGGSGDDSVNGFGDFTASDRFDGGAGFDRLILNGDYSGGLTLGTTSLTHVEQISLFGANTYVLTLANMLTFGESLSVDAGGASSVTLNCSAITEGPVKIVGSNGADILTVGSSGLDIVKAGGGTDIVRVFDMVETLRLDGGGGVPVDTLVIFGNYQDEVQFGSRTVQNFDVIQLTAGGDKNFALADANVGLNGTITVDGSALSSSDVMTFDCSDDSNSILTINGGDAPDILIAGQNVTILSGGDGNDHLYSTLGGTDQLYGGNGNDTLHFLEGSLSGSDHLGGGAGTDTLVLDGETGAQGLDIFGIESIVLDGGDDYLITMSSENADITTLDATDLGTSDTLLFSGSSAFDDGVWLITGGLGADQITGGFRADTIDGSDGNDILAGDDESDEMTGGAGADQFRFFGANDSTSTTYDTVTDLSLTSDKFDVPGTSPITGIDAAVMTGTLSTATFNSNMASALSGHLLAHHAILYTPNAGTLSGETFLVIDLDGTSGYDTGLDLVIMVTGFTGTLGTTDII